MKVFAKILVVMLVVGLSSQLFAKEITKTVGDYKVSAEIGKKYPVVGDNIVKISIKDKANKPVKDAKINLLASMPAMPGMPAMSEEGKVKSKGANYEGKVNLSMSGSWVVEVTFTIGKKTQKATYSVDVR